MPQSLSNIHVLLTWSTKRREPLIDRQLQKKLFAYISGICKRVECYPIRVGGDKDHVHVYCQLSRKIGLMKFLELLKKESAKWAKTQGMEYSQFYWQEGYHAISVNPKQTDTVIQYLDNQAEHHRSRSYQEECRLFFRKFGMKYDERYVWD